MTVILSWPSAQTHPVVTSVLVYWDSREMGGDVSVSAANLIHLVDLDNLSLLLI